MTEGSGYEPGGKFLIIHADDVGMCHSVNIATIEAFRKGAISSCSLMMPCPWILEAVEFLKDSKYDYGIHSTLTSEWEFYRWGPVAPDDEVDTLLDDQGYLWRSVGPVARGAKPEHVEKELNAQVERAERLGLSPSHLDTHMGTVYMREDFLKIYVNVALEHGIVPMVVRPRPEVLQRARETGIAVSDAMVSYMRSLKIPKLDHLYTTIPGNTLDDMLRGFRNIVRSIGPGEVAQVIVHLGTDSEELRAVIGEGYKRRYLDLRLVLHPDAKRIIEEHRVTLVGYRDIARNMV